jgi:hypothetical protein
VPAIAGADFRHVFGKGPFKARMLLACHLYIRVCSDSEALLSIFESMD